MTYEFFIPLRRVPTITGQQRRIGVTKNNKGYVYDPEKIKAVRSLFEAYLAKHAPKQRIMCGVRLLVKWCFPITGKHFDGEYKLTRPDTDNLQKLLKDSMTKVGFWKDDALVCSEIVEKFYAANTGIYIRVDEL